MTELQANFTLEPQEPINASFEIGEQIPMEATLSLDVTNYEHDLLIHRDYPDQHPISAITGLQDILNKVWTFTFEQELATDTWVIVHNLGRNPNVVAVDSAGSVQIPDDVHYDSENQITVRFVNAFAGKAFLN